MNMTVAIIISSVIAFGVTAALGFVIIPWLRNHYGCGFSFKGRKSSDGFFGYGKQPGKHPFDSKCASCDRKRHCRLS